MTALCIILSFATAALTYHSIMTAALIRALLQKLADAKAAQATAEAALAALQAQTAEINDPALVAEVQAAVA